MERIYKNRNFLLYSLLTFLLPFSIAAIILNVSGIFYSAPAFIVSFIFLMFFIINPVFNSALLHKIIISGDKIEIRDRMPVLYIRLPGRQLVNIHDILEIFSSEHDMHSSIKSSRMSVNKNSMSYRNILKNNPRLGKFLVFKLKNSSNAYMRYFNCLSLKDRTEILGHILSLNKNIKIRLSEGELKLYKGTSKN